MRDMGVCSLGTQAASTQSAYGPTPQGINTQLGLLLEALLFRLCVSHVTPFFNVFSQTTQKQTPR